MGIKVYCFLEKKLETISFEIFELHFKDIKLKIYTKSSRIKYVWILICCLSQFSNNRTLFKIIKFEFKIFSGKLVPKEAEHHLQTTLCDDFDVNNDTDVSLAMPLTSATSSSGQFGKPERKLSPKHPLIETLSGNGRRTHVRSRSDASGLLSVGNSSKYLELSGQLHQHLNQVKFDNFVLTQKCFKPAQMEVLLKGCS